MAHNQRKLKKLFIEILEKGNTVLSACDKLDVARATFYRWKERDQVFDGKTERSIEIGQEVINDLAVTKLVQNINNGDMRAIVYQLDRRHPRYKQGVTERGSEESGFLNIPAIAEIASENRKLEEKVKKLEDQLSRG